MDDFDLDDAAIAAAEQKANEVANRAPEVAEGDAECDGCKI